MKVGVLGSLSVVGDDGRSRSLGGQKQRGVFAMLALEPNTHISIDRLAEGVWGDLVPERYVQNVQVYVSTLRRILEPDRTSMMPSRIVAHGPSYELVLADDELDLSRFRSRVRDGIVAYEARQPATAAIALRTALGEWRGQPCADLPDLPFQATAARLLDDEWWVAFERCIDAELDNGRSGELVAELEQALSRSPIRERTWEQLVLALYRAGRQGDALAAYGRARGALVEELGLDPGARLRALEREVLEQSPALDAPARASVREARLPVPLTSLIGRDRLISDVSARLFDQRLVVLTGPGGVGKTRVALAVAARCQSEGRPIFFADLTTVRDVALVAPAIARSVGLVESAGASEVAEVAEREGALLVIDNVEQVVDAADFIASVVALAPGARALVTSRVRLGIPGECVIEVEPLASDVGDAPAVKLFWERARAIDPRLEPSRHPDAARIVCRAVDGMPLAIELAASRVDVFDPSELARRLAAAIDSAVDFGTGGRRHGSMRAAIRWSTDLLDQKELTLFGALSVCAAPVDFPTVLAIGAGAGLDARTAERALENLARASLLRTAETPAGRRFGLLTTTKAIARDLLSPSISHLVEAAHADWFAARALEQRGAADDTWLPQAVADLPDSVVAIERLAARGEASGATDLLAGVFTVAMMTADRYRFVRAVATELVERYSLPPALAGC